MLDDKINRKAILEVENLAMQTGLQLEILCMLGKPWRYAILVPKDARPAYKAAYIEAMKNMSPYVATLFQTELPHGKCDSVCIFNSIIPEDSSSRFTEESVFHTAANAICSMG
jgi:hypothetical protein